MTGASTPREANLGKVWFRSDDPQLDERVEGLELALVNGEPQPILRRGFSWHFLYSYLERDIGPEWFVFVRGSTR